jgi:hypothetical protein
MCPILLSLHELLRKLPSKSGDIIHFYASEADDSESGISPVTEFGTTGVEHLGSITTGNPPPPSDVMVLMIKYTGLNYLMTIFQQHTASK